MTKATKIVIGAIAAVLVLGFGGTWLYINVIKDDAPERLSLDDDSGLSSTTTVAEGSETAETTVGPGDGASASDGIDGEWTATGDSVVGYRAKEVLFGQDTEGVGRTSSVTGTLTISGTSVDTAKFEVDMTTLKSDQDRRDGQVRGRIMETEKYPTSAFELTSPIDLGSIPADGTEITAKATGNLTIKAETKEVTLDLAAKKDGNTISVLTEYRIQFEEWGIEDPSFGPAQVEDNALLEIKLVFEKA